MDTPPQENTLPQEEKQRSSPWRWVSRLVRLCIVLIVIGVSSVISYHWVMNPPTTERRPRPPEATLVETDPIVKTTHQVVVRAMGTVIPARQMNLAARISGQIIDISPEFVPGGHFGEGSQILKIDPKDYELAVEQQQGSLTRMESDARIEMGQQSVARREFELLYDELQEGDEELLLRQPQLAAKKAAVEEAKAMLEKAQLDLQRTTIFAPFNTIIHTRNVNLGSYVSPGSTLATLIGADEFWVETSVPVDELQWITVPDDNNGEGSLARIYHTAAWGPETYRTGRVIRLLPDLEPQGRMARILVSVENPLGNSEENKPPLLLDSFVRVAIEGADLDDVAAIPRTAIRGGSQVWVMEEDNTLAIRDIEIIWGANEVVYVSEGIEDGEALVVSGIASPVVDMPLRTADMPIEERGNGQGGGSQQGAGGGQGGGGVGR